MSSGRTTVIEWAGDWLKLARAEQSRITGLWFRRVEGDPVLALAGLLREVPGELGAVVAILPRPMATLRVLEFPSLDPREIRDMVELQIGRLTPYSRDEMVADFKIIGSERAGYGQVFLAIAPASAARQRFGLPEECGLTVERLTVGTEALMHLAVLRERPDVGVLDLDSNAAEFCVRRAGQPVFSRTIPVGASALAARVGEEEHRFLQEFHRAVDSYRNENPGARLETVLTTGAAFPSADWLDRLRAEAGVAMEVAAPESDLSDEARGTLAQAAAAGVSLSAVLGAARAPGQLGLNLIPETVLSRRNLEKRARQLTGLGLLILALLTLASLALEGRIVRRRNLLNELRRQVAETGPAAARVEKQTQQAMAAGARLDARKTAVRVLTELHALIPETVTLTAIQIDRTTPPGQVAATLAITLRGQAPTVGDTVRLVGILEESPALANVRSTRTNTGRDKTDFEITCEVEAP
jgi:Tfp pilus assembly PilM family ATPase/Tfp pilus assembly protein PilN